MATDDNKREQPQPTAVAGNIWGPQGKAPILDKPHPTAAAYTGKGEQDVIDWIEGQMRAMPEPLSAAEVAKMKQRQRAEGIVAGITDAARALSNLYFTRRGAPNMFDPKASMSAKTQERWDKAKAEREATDARRLQLAMAREQILGQRADRQFQREQAEQQQKNWRQSFEAGRRDAAWTHSYQEQAYKDSRADRAEDVEFRGKQFAESVRQFDEGQKIARAQLGIQQSSLALQREQYNDSRYVTFNLGGQYGAVQVPINNINDQAVAAVFATLPPDEQSNVHGKAHTIPNPETGGLDNITVFEEPTAEDMWKAIGRFVVDHPSDDEGTKTARNRTRAAIKSLQNTKPNDELVY